MNIKTSMAVAAAVLVCPASAMAQASSYKAQSPVVVERAASGRAIAVRADGEVYPVCMTERQDSCIQPRAAGLGWGDRPAMTWKAANESRLGG